MTIWDIGGQDKIRKLWKHYYEQSDGVIFVVDSADATRINDVADELEKLHREPSLDCIPFLIFANKQDLPNAMAVNQLGAQLNIPRMISRNWKIQGCCAVSGDGLYEGLDWMKKKMGKTQK